MIKIDNFDLWFQPFRQEIPIYLAAVFPKMLETTGEIAQGALLTWCTLDHAQTAAHHVAVGVRRGGKNPEDVEVASLISCGVAADSTSVDEARDSFRPVIAGYAARFPRYRRLMAEAGFHEELEAVRQAWREGNQQEAQAPNRQIECYRLAGTVPGKASTVP